MALMNTMWEADSKYNRIIDLAFAFQKSRALFTAIELDLFEALGNHRLTAAELSDKLNTDAHSTDRLLNALSSMGLISKEGSLYSNSEAALKHLISGSPTYIGSLEHIKNLWGAWTDLTDCVKSGKPLHYKTVNDKDDNWINDYLESLQWKSIHEASEVISMMPLRNVRKFLDLGCGSGAFSLEAAVNYENIEFTLFDYPNVIKQAEKYINQSEYKSRFKLLSGDMFADNFGTGYDVVFISNVLNEYSIWENIKLLQKVYDSLNKNGIVVVHQLLISDDRTAPRIAAMEALNMLVNTIDGDCFTETDVWIMLKEAWFQDVQKFNTEFGTAVIIGKRTTSF